MTNQNSGAIQPALKAYATIVTNPLPGSVNVTRVVRTGTRICDLVPPNTLHTPVMVRYNGEWLLRRDWLVPLGPEDHVEIHLLPQGGDRSNVGQIIAAIIVVVISVMYGPQFGAFLSEAFGLGLSAAAAASLGSFAISLAGSLILGAIFKPDVVRGGGGPERSSNYNVALSGNQARLNEPIPVLYGYNRSFPDFAAQPYQEYNNETDDQYYHALLCIGQGEYKIHSIEVDDTPLGHFKDITAIALPPGTLPTIVQGNVVTAPEVTGQEPESGRFVGPYTVCGPLLAAKYIGIDIVFAGLGTADDEGEFIEKWVHVRIDVRTVNDFGDPVDNWTQLGSEIFKGATADAIRKSFKYELSPPRRVEIRMVRIDIKDDNNRTLNTPQWTGLRAYLAQPATLSPTATHLEIKIRANEQLNGLSQRKIAVRSTRKLPIYDSETGTWSAPQATREIAWALADKWRSTIYGDALGSNYINMDALLELHDVWTARQDRFDFIFDSRMTSWEAEQLIAGAGRAAVIRRQGVMRTVIRDQSEFTFLTGFASNMIRKGSYAAEYNLANENTPDGIKLEYWDNRRFDYRTLNCPCPGVDADAMVNPQRMRIYGVSGETHARREGLFLAAASYYRRKRVSFSTELLGLLPTYGSLIRIAPAVIGWGTSGFVLEYSPGQRTMLLSEGVTFPAAQQGYITFLGPTGQWSEVTACSPNGSLNEILLAADPPIDIVYDDADREPTKFVFGTSGTIGELMVVRSIRPAGRDDGGSIIVEIQGMAENPLVHKVDEHLLPTADEVQDPVGSPEDPDPDLDDDGLGPGGETILVVSIDDFGVERSVEVWNTGGPGTAPEDFYTDAVIEFTKDGLLRLRGSDAEGWIYLNRQWSVYGVVEPVLTAEYSIKAEVLNDQNIPGWMPQEMVPHIGSASAAVDTWLDLTEDRRWTMAPSEYLETPQIGYLTRGWAVAFRISIRNTASGNVVDSARYYLMKYEIVNQESTGGGDSGGGVGGGADGDGSAGDG